MAFTYFFRDLQVLELSIDHLLPGVSGRSRVRIWNAGCATGMETYSLTMLLAEKMGNFAFKNLMIDASDIDENGQFGSIVKEGVYGEEHLKRIPEDLFHKYFTPAENEGYYKVNEQLNSRITFHRHDLTSLKPIGQSYSFILCKNVLLHLNHQQRIEVIRMFHESLLPDGLFAMEHTQSIPVEISHLFKRVVTNAQLYQKIQPN